MAFFPRPVTRMMSWLPEATASSTAYWIVGLSTMGSISLGWALVSGRNRVPSPAAGKAAFRIVMLSLLGDSSHDFNHPDQVPPDTDRPMPRAFRGGCGAGAPPTTDEFENTCYLP